MSAPPVRVVAVAEPREAWRDRFVQRHRLPPDGVFRDWRELLEGPRRCDAVDHQVVALEFEGGLTATFTMTAFTQHAGRRIRVHGTEGEIEFTEERMQVRTFADRLNDEVLFAAEEGGHGGGDARVVRSFLAAVQRGDPSLVSTGIPESLRTHAIVFAAERSRRLGRSVELSEVWG